MRTLAIRPFLCVVLLFLGDAMLVRDLHAQATDTLDVQLVMQSLATGEAAKLMALAGERVELALLGQTRRYSRAQALYVLNAFFQQYPPEAFSLSHSLTQGDEWWLTGLYQVRYEETRMRVYLRLSGQYPAYKLLAIQIIRL